MMISPVLGGLHHRMQVANNCTCLAAVSSPCARVIFASNWRPAAPGTGARVGASTRIANPGGAAAASGISTWGGTKG